MAPNVDTRLILAVAKEKKEVPLHIRVVLKIAEKHCSPGAIYPKAHDTDAYITSQTPAGSLQAPALAEHWGLHFQTTWYHRHGEER